VLFGAIFKDPLVGICTTDYHAADCFLALPCL
jgi:hypothetical protein